MLLVEELVGCIPEELKRESGKAFHCGRLAFSCQRDLYVLGLNPGGDPGDLSETVERNATWVLRDAPEDWAALLDQSWRGCIPGQAPLQRTLRSLLERLGFEPREVPFSDVVFARSRQAGHIADAQKQRLMELCWPFHRAVIQQLGVRVVLCLYLQGSVGVRPPESRYEPRPDLSGLREVLIWNDQVLARVLCDTGWPEGRPDYPANRHPVGRQCVLARRRSAGPTGPEATPWR